MNLNFNLRFQKPGIYTPDSEIVAVVGEQVPLEHALGVERAAAEVAEVEIVPCLCMCVLPDIAIFEATWFGALMPLQKSLLLEVSAAVFALMAAPLHCQNDL